MPARAAARGRGSGKELLVADAGDLRAFWFPVRDKDSAIRRPSWLTSRSAGAGRTPRRSTVTARTLLRDLLLQADRLGPAATADRGLITLLPGESATFAVRGWDRPAPEAAAAALYCVNGAVTSSPRG